jgi:hypothetical protein
MNASLIQFTPIFISFEFETTKKTTRTGSVGPLHAPARQAGLRPIFCPTPTQMNQDRPFASLVCVGPLEIS